jgi:hypothetical protein
MQATPAVQTRPAIAAPDADISALPRYPCEGAALVRLGAISSAAGASLACRVIWYDALGLFAGVSSSVLFVADGTAGDGASCLATPEPDGWLPVGGPSAFSVRVDLVSAGTWTVTAMAQ